MEVNKKVVFVIIAALVGLVLYTVISNAISHHTEVYYLSEKRTALLEKPLDSLSRREAQKVEKIRQEVETRRQRDSVNARAYAKRLLQQDRTWETFLDALVVTHFEHPYTREEGRKDERKGALNLTERHVSEANAVLASRGYKFQYKESDRHGWPNGEKSHEIFTLCNSKYNPSYNHSRAIDLLYPNISGWDKLMLRADIVELIKKWGNPF